MKNFETILKQGQKEAKSIKVDPVDHLNVDHETVHGLGGTYKKKKYTLFLGEMD